MNILNEVKQYIWAAKHSATEYNKASRMEDREFHKSLVVRNLEEAFKLAKAESTRLAKSDAQMAGNLLRFVIANAQEVKSQLTGPDIKKSKDMNPREFNIYKNALANRVSDYAESNPQHMPLVTRILGMPDINSVEELMKSANLERLM